jgi:hypothetical protein
MCEATALVNDKISNKHLDFSFYNFGRFGFEKSFLSNYACISVLSVSVSVVACRRSSLSCGRRVYKNRFERNPPPSFLFIHISNVGSEIIRPDSFGTKV